MRKMILSALLLGTLAGPLAMTSASAQPFDRGPPGPRGDRDYRWDGDRRDWDASRAYRDDRRWRGRERRLAREDRVYHGQDGRYYCRRTDGTTGLVVGGLGGGLAGGLIGGDTLGALVGAGAGALLGRSIDRGNVRCR